jgi:hypothetical protein
MKRSTIFLTLTALCLCLLAASALAMSSANYRLDWFTPLTSGGGGAVGSAGYVANLTVGQTAIGSASSSSYRACLGYWCGAEESWRVYLPLITKN